MGIFCSFYVFNSQSNIGGHPLIIGRPWLGTTDAFISCISGDMYIFYGGPTKKFTLYPPKKTITEVESEFWIDDDNENFDDIQLVFTLSQIDEEDQLINLMNNNDYSSYCEQIKVFKDNVILNIYHLIKWIYILLENLATQLKLFQENHYTLIIIWKNFKRSN